MNNQAILLAFLLLATLSFSQRDDIVGRNLQE